MKQIKLIFLGLALLMGSLLAGVNGTEVLYPSISSAGEKIVPYDKSDEIEYGYGGTYDIGTYVNNDSDTCTVRTQYEFDLSSIDNHANITKVTVYYAMDEKSYTFKLT